MGSAGSEHDFGYTAAAMSKAAPRRPALLGLSGAACVLLTVVVALLLVVFRVPVFAALAVAGALGATLIAVVWSGVARRTERQIAELERAVSGAHEAAEARTRV